MSLSSRLCVCLLMLLPATAALTSADEPRPAHHAPLAAKGLTLDLVRAGQRYVAVGERGHVLLSSDGRDWEQAEFVPVQSTLTRVTFAGGRLWAVGHDSTIIHSRDMGRTWSIQHFEPDWEKPLLDVHFFNSNEGIAIGAYGLLMRTSNAGHDWEVLDMADLVTSEAIDWEEAARAVDEYEDEFDDPFNGFNDIDDEFDDDFDNDFDEEYYDPETDFDRGCYEFMECHLNAFLSLNNGLQMIAAERGYGFRSTDHGETWEAFRFPYPGSMFGLLNLGDGGILAFGLRGHVQLSTDFGDNWEILESGLESSLMGGTSLGQGRFLMVGNGAARLRYDRSTGRFSLSEDRLGSSYVSVLVAEDGTIIYAGEDGLSHE